LGVRVYAVVPIVNTRLESEEYAEVEIRRRPVLVESSVAPTADLYLL
jgi:hypothetical protein